MQGNHRLLIAIDLDNTILTDLFSLSSESVQSLISAQESGHVIMIATARPSCMTLPYYHAMGLRGPVSTLNGGHLYHPGNPEFPVYHHRISEKSVAAFLEASARADVRSIWLIDDDNLFTPLAPTAEHIYFREILRHSRLHVQTKLSAVPVSRIMAWTESREQTDKIISELNVREEISVSVHPSSGGGHHISCFASGADKWHSVKRAANWYGISQENIIAFGDEENDRKMLFNAGRGFVMRNGNANLLEDARRSGVSITEYPCSEGGVGREIRNILACS